MIQRKGLKTVRETLAYIGFCAKQCFQVKLTNFPLPSNFPLLVGSWKLELKQLVDYYMYERFMTIIIVLA
jgi:hypothetical protein